MSRLSGETFSSIYDRLSVNHGFHRSADSLPETDKLQDAVRALQLERKAYLKNYRSLMKKRRLEKSSGRRYKRQEELDTLERRRARHNQAMMARTELARLVRAETRPS